MRGGLAGWRHWLADKGRKYFHHAGTNITQWELPAALPPRPDKAPTEERRKAGLNEAAVRAVAHERSAEGGGQRGKLPATATDAVSGPAGGAKAVRKAAAAEAGGERPAALETSRELVPGHQFYPSRTLLHVRLHPTTTLLRLAKSIDENKAYTDCKRSSARSTL